MSSVIRNINDLQSFFSANSTVDMIHKFQNHALFLGSMSIICTSGNVMNINDDPDLINSASVAGIVIEGMIENSLKTEQADMLFPFTEKGIEKAIDCVDTKCNGSFISNYNDIVEFSDNEEALNKHFMATSCENYMMNDINHGSIRILLS